MAKRRRDMTDSKIIAVVSGKGGVGKTMLAVALANELSRECKTLLFDLDFFNRGLTGLLASLQSQIVNKAVNAPQFIKQREDNIWSIAEVSKNVFMVYYDDLVRSETDFLETHDTAELSKELLVYVEYLLKEASCEFAVLDCHGGPDNTSFAACAIATEAILVSEPDKVTLHGTLNFLRMLRQNIPDMSPHIRLAFNKVVAAFSSIFLTNFYDQYLRKEFAGNDLLAIYPLEIYLTKAFERMPFLTWAYPQSQLAIKTRLVLYELFHSEKEVHLPPQVAALTAVERFMARYYMGRWPRLLDLDFTLTLIAVFSLLLYVVNYYDQLLPNVVDIQFLSVDRDTGYGLIGVEITVLWAISVIISNWSRELDIFFTYKCRSRDFMMAGATWLILVGISSGLAITLAAWLIPTISAISIKTVSFEAIDTLVTALFLVIWLVVSVFVLSLYFRRGIRNIRFDNCYSEGLLRMAFLPLFVVSLIAFYLVSSRL
jgi:cellulose biosynthesis protein BcsQ